MESKKTITWITAGCFVDVDIDVVPSLATHYYIRWCIWGPVTDSDRKRVDANVGKTNLSIEYVSPQKKWYLPQAFFEYRALLKQVQKDCDLLYVDVGGGLWFYQALYSVCNLQKTVLAIHNVKTPKGARLEHLAKIMTSYAILHFTNIQTFSKNQHAYLNSRVSGKNVLEAPLMLKDYGALPAVELHKGINFLTFGHIRGYKRVDLLIEAAQMLYQQGKRDFKVFIVGNCKNWSEYESLITIPELFDNHIGFVENDDIPKYFADADFFVLPYQDLAQSGAITVAFQYNVPVITSDIEQFQEFNGDECRGLQFKNCDVADLSRVMGKAIDMSSSQRESMKAAQKEFVDKEFSASSILGRYKDYFNRLLAQ